MQDKEKIDTLITYYLRECDFTSIDNISDWELRFISSRAIKCFIYPLLEAGVLKIE